jgi:hypothetical protein
MSESESPIQWHTSLEDYFASTGEKANCLAWCHKRAEALYSNRRTWIDLPVILISAVTGFLSAGSTSLFDDPKTSSVALGVASLFVSVLNTAGSYFGWAKRAEGHRISAIHYSKLYRALMVELGLPREERQSPSALLRAVREQYDRLQEVSPLLPVEVIKEFQTKFKDYKDISKPEETNGLESITIYPPLGTNAPGSNLTLRALQGEPEGVSMLRGRAGGLTETRNPLHGGQAGEGTDGGGQSGGHQELRIE